MAATATTTQAIQAINRKQLQQAAQRLRDARFNGSTLPAAQLPSPGWDGLTVEHHWAAINTFKVTRQAKEDLLAIEKQLTRLAPEKPTSATAVVGGLALCAAVPAAALLIFMTPWLGWGLLAAGITGQALYDVCGKGAKR